MNYYVLDSEILIAGRKRYLVFDAHSLVLKSVESGYLSKINYISHLENIFMLTKDNQQTIIEFTNSS